MAFAAGKGTPENALTCAGFSHDLSLPAPAYIYPVEPRKEPNFSYRLLRSSSGVFACYSRTSKVIRADDLAAMVGPSQDGNVARGGPVFETVTFDEPWVDRFASTAVSQRGIAGSSGRLALFRDLERTLQGNNPPSTRCGPRKGRPFGAQAALCVRCSAQFLQLFLSECLNAISWPREFFLLFQSCIGMHMHQNCTFLNTF